MRLFRLYAPAIAIAAWAILTFAISFSHEIRGIASLVVAVSLALSIDESRQRYQTRQDRKDGDERS